ncbi:MAG: hypothetical protein ACRC6F_07810, partial [Aeromonas sp.]
SEYVGILIALTMFFAALPFVIYAIRKPHWRDENSDFAPFTWESESGHPGIQNLSSVHTADVLHNAANPAINTPSKR